MVIETSKDLLFVVLAFCAMWLTIFLSWLLYYVIVVIRDTKTLIRFTREAAEKIDALAHAAHEKMERSAASFTLIAQAVKELAVWAIKEHALKKKPSGSKRRHEEE